MKLANIPESELVPMTKKPVKAKARPKSKKR